MKTIPIIPPTTPKKNKPKINPIAEMNRATGQKISVSPPAITNTATVINAIKRNIAKLTNPIIVNGSPTNISKNRAITSKNRAKGIRIGLSAINVRMSGIMFHMIWKGSVKIQNGNRIRFRNHANGHEIQLNGQKFQINSTSG